MWTEKNTTNEQGVKDVVSNVHTHTHMHRAHKTEGKQIKERKAAKEATRDRCFVPMFCFWRTHFDGQGLGGGARRLGRNESKSKTGF